MDKILEAESSIVTPWTALGDKDRRKSRVMGGVGDKHMSERSLEGEGGEERTLSKQEYRRLKKETRKREVITLCTMYMYMYMGVCRFLSLHVAHFGPVQTVWWLHNYNVDVIDYGNFRIQ